jgi:hypothetical protein
MRQSPSPTCDPLEGKGLGVEWRWTLLVELSSELASGWQKCPRAEEHSTIAFRNHTIRPASSWRM